LLAVAVGGREVGDPEQLVVAFPAQRGVDGVDEFVRGGGEKIDAPGNGGSLLADGGVQAGEVAVEPVVGGGGSEPCELPECGRLALGGEEAVELAGDSAELVVPTVPQVVRQVGAGPAAAVAGDDVAQKLEAVPALPASGGPDADAPVRQLQLMKLGFQVLGWPEVLLGADKLVEQAGDRGSKRASVSGSTLG
jgi:hypothetical protein